jgi:hypothetical protein
VAVGEALGVLVPHLVAQLGAAAVGVPAVRAEQQYFMQAVAVAALQLGVLKERRALQEIHLHKSGQTRFLIV